MTAASASLLVVASLLGQARPAQAEEPPAPTRPGLLRQIGGDFRRFGSRRTLVTLGVGGAASLAFSPWDRRITDSFKDSANLDRFLEIGDTAGGGLVQGGAALGTYAIGRLFHKPGAADLGRDLIRAQVLNGVLTEALKLTVRRERPDGSSRLSFPSGHSSATFATATVLERHYGWKVGVPAYALGGYVAASRLQDNKHFPSDVVFGAALGIAAGRSIAVSGAKGRVSLAPGFLPQGPGVVLAFRPARP